MIVEFSFPYSNRRSSPANYTSLNRSTPLFSDQEVVRTRYSQPAAGARSLKGIRSFGRREISGLSRQAAGNLGGADKFEQFLGVPRSFSLPGG